MNNATAIAAARMRLAAGPPSGVFEGYASLFGVIDAGGDVIAPGAFAASLSARKPSGIRMLFQHDPAQPVGVWLALREDARGLFVRGRLTKGVTRASELHALLADGAIDGLSIGFRTRSAARDRANGRRTIFRLDLLEVSLVTFPMLAGARVNGLKAAALPAASPSAVPPVSGRPLHAAFQPRAPNGIAARLRRGATMLQH